MNKKHMPIVDSEIKCPICKGTKKHPRYSHADCGACFGTGRSTNPYDQRYNATTIGRELDETLPDHYTVHSAGHPVKTVSGTVRIVGILVSWVNPDYERRLALDKAGLL